MKVCGRELVPICGRKLAREELIHLLAEAHQDIHALDEEIAQQCGAIVSRPKLSISPSASEEELPEALFAASLEFLRLEDLAARTKLARARVPAAGSLSGREDETLRLRREVRDLTAALSKAQMGADCNTRRSRTRLLRNGGLQAA